MTPRVDFSLTECVDQETMRSALVSCSQLVHYPVKEIEKRLSQYWDSLAYRVEVLVSEFDQALAFYGTGYGNVFDLCKAEEDYDGVRLSGLDFITPRESGISPKAQRRFSPVDRALLAHGLGRTRGDLRLPFHSVAADLGFDYICPLCWSNFCSSEFGYFRERRRKYYDVVTLLDFLFAKYVSPLSLTFTGYTIARYSEEEGAGVEVTSKHLLCVKCSKTLLPLFRDRSETVGMFTGTVRLYRNRIDCSLNDIDFFNYCLSVLTSDRNFQKRLRASHRACYTLRFNPRSESVPEAVPDNVPIRRVFRYKYKRVAG